MAVSRNMNRCSLCHLQRQLPVNTVNVHSGDSSAFVTHRHKITLLKTFVNVGNTKVCSITY